MTLNRRRFLTLSAAALAAGPVAAETRATWRGIALGAPASLQIRGLSQDEAAPIFASVESELHRLEEIFSLYRPTSALAQLNRTGQLAAPPPELLEILSLSGHLHHASGGAFDPTVQPLFEAIAKATTEHRAVTDAERAAAVTLVGWNAVNVQPSQITLTRPGAALTLNGIAQGLITDRISTLLKAQGLTDVLVDMGEARILGGPWRTGIRDTAGQITRRLTLTDKALATSAPFGSGFGSEGHIFAPATGQTSTTVQIVSVTAPTAALADGLSTALAAGASKTVVSSFPFARIAHIS